MLIDINSIEQLNNIRYTLDGSGYREPAGTDLRQSVRALIGTTPCIGYELMRNLDFADATSYASGMVDATLRPNNSDPDAATNSGWEPIGVDSDGNRFSSRFEGNGYTISNLYGRLISSGSLGLFGAADNNSIIRSVGVAAARLYGSDASDDIGALVGESSGIIIASYANTTIDGGAGGDTIGALVGRGATGGTIIASYANGMVSGNAGNDIVGGLVGRNSNLATIIAAYANGMVSGNAGRDSVGGLVGSLTGPIVIASYARGIANGGADGDNVGGLGGAIVTSTITASYATTIADGGADSNNVGSVGPTGGAFNFLNTYGFGATSNIDTPGSDGTTPRPEGVAAAGEGIEGARTLTLAAAGAQWNQVVVTTAPDTTITTMDAWDFGDNTEAPALRYADYDGAGDTYACGGTAITPAATIPDIVATPTGPMTITCGTTLLPEQER